MHTSKPQSVRSRLAQRVRLLRVLHGWSQERLAENCGLHRTYIGAVERAERNITVDNVAKIAAALRVPIGALFDDSDLLRWSAAFRDTHLEESHAAYRTAPPAWVPCLKPSTTPHTAAPLH